MAVTVGQRMKERRTELRLSARDLAVELGISPATYYRYEKGEIEKIPSEVLLKLATRLQTTTDSLLGLTSGCRADTAVPLLTSCESAPLLCQANIEKMLPAAEGVHADFAVLHRRTAI